MAQREYTQQNWINKVSREFSHPATVLWRATELRVLEKALGKYRLSDPILDVGCAEGKIASFIFRDRQIFGLDNCWELIKQNNKTGIYKGLVFADALNMPFKDNTIETLFSNCVIEHIYDLDGFLNETKRVLKKNGLFIFTAPSHNFGEFLFFSKVLRNLGLSKLSELYIKKRNLLLSHFHCYNHEKWNEELKRNNFTLVEHIYYMDKKTVMLWDFLAVLFFILSRIKILDVFQKKITHRLKYILTVFSNIESSMGGGIAIIAMRR